MYPDDGKYATHQLQNLESEILASFTKRLPVIAIVTGGLHYLHLFPARPFEGRLRMLLGNYRKELATSLDALREHIGPKGLVIWKTVNNICDGKYDGHYAETLSRIRSSQMGLSR
jgi:hypothetical protein